MPVWATDPTTVRGLAIMHHYGIINRQPHCPRCKGPVVFYANQRSGGRDSYTEYKWICKKSGKKHFEAAIMSHSALQGLRPTSVPPFLMLANLMRLGYSNSIAQDEVASVFGITKLIFSAAV